MEQERNPFAAALMNIFPGLGHFYLRDTFYAIIYFVIFWVAGIVSFFVWYYKLDQNYTYGMMMIVVFAFIWAFSIFDAFRDAKKINAKLRGDWDAKLNEDV